MAERRRRRPGRISMDGLIDNLTVLNVKDKKTETSGPMKQSKEKHRKNSATLPKKSVTEVSYKPKRKYSVPTIKTTSRKVSFPDESNWFVKPKFYKEDTSQLSEGETSDLSSTDLPPRTPDAEIVREFSPTSDMSAESCTYQPRFCWCTRCKLMYRMNKESDTSLSRWGNYPCFRF